MIRSLNLYATGLYEIVLAKAWIGLGEVGGEGQHEALQRPSGYSVEHVLLTILREFGFDGLFQSHTPEYTGLARRCQE